MIVTTFEEDLFGLSDFADRLEKFIDVERDYVEGSLVVALNSKFGSGKTTFLRMWSHSLDTKADRNDKRLVVCLNAWESDYVEDPLFAIVSALIERIDKKGDSATDLTEAAKDLGWFGVAILGQLVNRATGVDPVAASKHAEDKKTEREGKAQVPSDTFSVYEKRRKAMGSLKKAIRKYVEDKDVSLLFLVDELDRCRPDYAISYLETIKHIFDVKGAVFVLAADREQLENSAKAAFGPDLGFEEYYRKFVHREVSLPPISEQGYTNIAAKYVPYYLEREGARWSCMKLDQHRTKNISELIGALNMTPRQIQEVFRGLGHMCEATEEKRGELRWCYGVGCILMATCKTGYPEIYKSLGRKAVDPLEIHQFFQKLFDRYDAAWWFNLVLTGGGLKIEEGEDPEAVMKKVGLVKNGKEFDERKELGQWYAGWGRAFRQGADAPFSHIYDRIEQLSQWF